MPEALVDSSKGLHLEKGSSMMKGEVPSVDAAVVVLAAGSGSGVGSADGKSYVLCKTIIFFSSLLFLYSELQYTFA